MWTDPCDTAAALLEAFEAVMASRIRLAFKLLTIPIDQ